MKATEDQIEEIKSLASTFGGTFDPYYSGRSMYGKTCLGVITDDPDVLKEEAAGLGIRGAREDNMGRQYIVYWPSLETDWETQSAGPSRD
jgi:hypothetical protein